MFDEAAYGEANGEAEGVKPLAAALATLADSLSAASGAVAGREVRELLDAVGVCEGLITR
jgi:hypothetical protein